MHRLIVLVSTLCLFVLDCSSQPSSKSVMAPDKIETDLLTFLTYRQNHLRLSENFHALDEASKTISKRDFLERLTSGEHLPLRLQTTDSLAVYQLHRLSTNSNADVRQTIQQWGTHLLTLYRMEGRAFPAFRVTDLEGTLYTNENTAGKILVLKCWFIGCIPCVKEMPELNKLKRKYERRDDIRFISLALDPAAELQAFLQKKRFDYAVAGDQKNLLEQALKIDSYPTHILVNKQGLITKVVNDHKELAVALEKEALLQLP